MLLHNPFLRRTGSRSVTSGRARAGSRERLTAESLEIRSLLSASWPGLLNPQSEAEPNNTLDAAQDLGNVSGGLVAEFAGSIIAPSLGGGESELPSDSAAGATTDVDWYSFTLVSSGRVRLTALPGAGGASSPVVLTLYGDQLDDFDPELPLQRRLLARQDGRSDDVPRPVDLRLEAGTYFVAVSGTGNRFFHPFVADSGVPGTGTDYGIRISVTGGHAPTEGRDQFASAAESGIRGDDTLVTARDLGDLTAVPRQQVSGRIGDDPFYNVASEDPFVMNPAADVDVFRFSITGDGTFGLIAESFAGRIGSPLDPALTLFRTDESGFVQFVAMNDNSMNPVESTNGQVPFFSDAVLFAGLSAGEYFLAVSSSGNDAESDPEGVFDLQIAHSGVNGGSVGSYVVDLFVYADNIVPQVVKQVFDVPGRGEIDLSDGHVESMSHAPTHLSLRFSEAVNVQQLAHSSFQQVGQNTVRAVYIEAADGTRYVPRFESYDSATETAHFLMLDGLPNGDFELHASGLLGLTDLAGNALGEFTRSFTVADASDVGESTLITNQPGNDSFETAQDLGVIFPHDLQSGVRLVRDAATASAQPADSTDFFRFELLQSKSYFFTLSNFGDGAPPAMEVLSAAGQVMAMVSLPGGQGLLGFLPAGEYVLHLGPWDTTVAGNMTYQVELKFGAASENPTPLTSGAAPAVGIRLAGHGPAAFNVSRPAPSVSATVASGSTPSGLNDNLAALPLGLPSNSTLAATTTANDNRIVRLFGFGDRDRLFSMIDSILSRPTSDPLSVTRAELTDSELADLIQLNGNASGSNTELEGSDETTSLDAATDEESSSEAFDGSGEAGPAGTNEANSNSSDAQPLTQRAAGPRRPARRLQPKSKPVEEQPINAAVSPLAITLAASLASTLRERARRERELSQEFVGV